MERLNVWFFPESNFEVSKEIKVINIIAYHWGLCQLAYLNPSIKLIRLQYFAEVTYVEMNHRTDQSPLTETYYSGF